MKPSGGGQYDTHNLLKKMVRKGGLEPPRVLPHQILNLFYKKTNC